MNRNLYLLFTFFICCCLQVTAQLDSINWLQEVRLSDVKLKNGSEGQLVKSIDDSLIGQSEPLLTSLLKFNSPFFFRENGYGMVSSASVRGTGAAQTAVIWNGININSQFTGQTDFNTINSRVFDNISLRPGGGSVIYGSSAIGGTVHLNNDFSFHKNSENELQIGYGSFETFQSSYKGDFSSEETNLKIAVAGVRSENDYKYPGTEARNKNGDFYNLSLNASIAQWIGDHNILKFYSNYYRGDRGFSGTLNLPSNSKYEDRNARNLLEWKSFSGNFTSSLRLAFLKEEFKYYENREADEFSFGEANTGIVKYELAYEFSQNKKLNIVGDFSSIEGAGTGINTAERRIGALSILWDHNIDKLNYQLSLRQEVTNNYESPLLFSVGASYRLSESYLLRMNSSRNFRMPSFNDLFWQQGGSLDLRPETSLQAEIGNEFIFGNFKTDLTAYYMSINNLIRWTPDGTGTWRPENTSQVYNYGMELFGEYKAELAGNILNIRGNYAYTRSIDRETGKQLIYTPAHKLGLSAGYNLGPFYGLIQSLYNGSIYTSSDNHYKLDAYKVFNLNLGYSISKIPEIDLNLSFRNIFNEEYQSLPSRYMPGRAFTSTLTFKF